MPIELTVTYNYKVKKYGLFGDEGRGVKLSKQNFVTRTSRSEFYIVMVNLSEQARTNNAN